MPHPDHDGLLLAALHLLDSVFQRLRSGNGVTSGADRLREAIRSESRRRTEVQFWAGGVDEVVVGQLTRLTLLRWVGVGDVNERHRIVVGSLRVNRGGERLVVLNALSSVDGGERKRHLLDVHAADAYPDVRRDPVPVRVRGDDDDLIGTPEHPRQMERRGVSSDTATQNHYSCHSGLLFAFTLKSTRYP